MLRRFALLWFLLAAFAAGAVGGVATQTSVSTWYRTLRKPVWTPPDWLFGPVWTALYVAMAVAAWRVWRKAGIADERSILRFYALQLVLNAAWSVCFFGMRRPGLALVTVVALWAVVVSMLVIFVHADRTAGALWLAYAGWVSFAAALNAAIWSLNA